MKVMRTKGLLLTLACALRLIFVEGAMISKSSVTLCENSVEEPSTPEGTTCSKKLLVTMGLKSGQGNTESLYANIDRAYKEYEGEQELSRLKKPFRIEISKSEVTIGYEVYYKGVSTVLTADLSASCDFFSISPVVR